MRGCGVGRSQRRLCSFTEDLSRNRRKSDYTGKTLPGTIFESKLGLPRGTCRPDEAALCEPLEQPPRRGRDPGHARDRDAHLLGNLEVLESLRTLLFLWSIWIGAPPSTPT